jgi:PilZ domain
MLSEQEPHILGRDRRQSARAVVDFRMIAADKAGLATGQVIDVMKKGCGLRLAKPLKRGQYLTLKVYPNDGTAAVQCDLVKVQWVEAERAGVTFLFMTRENELRLYRLCGERLGFAVEG